MNNILMLVTFLFLVTGCSNSQVKKRDGMIKVSDVENNIEDSSPESLIKKAKIFEQENNYTAALVLYQKLDKIKPDSIDIRLKMADAYRFTGKSANAKEIYADLLQKESNSSDQESEIYLHILEAIGMCMIQEGDFKGAIEALSAIFEIDAMRWRTVNALGVAYALSGNYQESEKYFKIALSLENNQYIIYNNMALASAFECRYDDAIKYQKQAIKFASKNSSNFERLEMNLALLFGLSGKSDSASEILYKYLPEEKVKNNLKYYASLAKNSDESKKLIRESLGAVNSDS